MGLGGDAEHEAVGAQDRLEPGVECHACDHVGGFDEVAHISDRAIDPVAGHQAAQPAALAREDRTGWGSGLVGVGGARGVRAEGFGWGDSEGAELPE